MDNLEPFKTSIVATKLYPPAFNKKSITRERLFDYRACEDKRLSIVSIVAAAGSGKSTTMAEICGRLNEMKFSTAWLSLDLEDNCPSTFVSYLIPALSKLDPLQDGSDLEWQRDMLVKDIEALFDILIARISRIDFPAAIFLDDFQHITDPSLVAFIDRLVARLPDCILLIVASRVQLPLSLGRLRVTGRLQEINQAHLNFNSREAEAFLQRSHELRLQAADLSSLHEITEGWPAGLQLAALALRQHKGPQSELIRQFSGCTRDLTTFLAESVLNSQPESVRQFLLNTAPLRRMCPDLCHAVSARTDCSSMLETLDRMQLFVVPLDGAGEWFRYHHLFGEFLKKLLSDSDPQQFKSVCEKAAVWCEAKGLMTDAIQYMLDAGHFEQAADMIADRALTESSIEADHHTVLDWMRRLPQQYHMRRPEINLAHAWSCAFSHDAARALELSQTVLAKLNDVSDQTWDIGAAQRQSLIHYAGVIQVIADATMDNFATCRERAEELNKIMPRDNGVLIGTALNCLSYAYLSARDFNSAIQTSSEARLQGEVEDSVCVMVWADYIRGAAAIELGKLRSAVELGERAEAAAMRGANEKGFCLAMAALLNAEIATQRCEFEKAERLMNSGRAFAVLFGPVEPLLRAFRSDAQILHWLGNHSEAVKRLEQGKSVALRFNYPRLLLALAIEEATLKILAGDIEAAGEAICLFKSHVDVASASKFSPVYGLGNSVRLLEARLQLAAGNPEKALREFSRLQYGLSSDADTTFLLTLRALKAIALWRLGRTAESVRELDKALSAASEDFCAYPILSAGNELLPIIEAIDSKRGRESDLIRGGKLKLERWIVAKLQGDKLDLNQISAVSVSTKRESSILTEREIELVKLADSGLTNKRIAKAQLITEATVKWHMHNIYEKLGVANRTAAAARSRELKII